MSDFIKFVLVLAVFFGVEALGNGVWHAFRSDKAGRTDLGVMLVAGLAAYGAYRLTRGRDFSAAGKPALIGGVVGLVGGFVGPILLTPEANQGPLLGLFITGPLGFIFGAVYGLGKAWKK